MDLTHLGSVHGVVVARRDAVVEFGPVAVTAGAYNGADQSAAPDAVLKEVVASLPRGSVPTGGS